MFREKINEISGFVEQVNRLQGRGKLPGAEVSLSNRPITLTGRIEQVYEDGLLFFRYGNLRGRDLMRGWLFHLVADQWFDEPPATTVICRDESVTLEPGTGAGGHLDMLVDLFLEGRRFPSPFHVEPAYAYAKQVIRNRGGGRRQPIQAAREALRKEIENNYEPEKSLLYPVADEELLLDEAFETLANSIMLPLLDSLGSCKQGGRDA
jgi:exodeoxyribonuclease V gamma subunit